MEHLWQLYAKVLNLLFRIIAARNSKIPYLLKEDEETLAFSAFTPSVRKLRFRLDSGGVKPVFSEATHGPRFSNNEMLFRIRGILYDGAFLVRQVRYPNFPS